MVVTAEIDDILQRIDSLEQRVVDIERRLGTTSKPTERPSETVPPAEDVY